MVLGKEDLPPRQTSRQAAEPDEALPAYEAGDPGSSSAAATSQDGISTQPTPVTTGTTKDAGDGPTASDPFHFPTDAPPPEYSESSGSGSRRLQPIAIPQTSPEATASFLTAYAPVLLKHGVTEQAWDSFVDTVSAFLTAKVSDRAISHAGDIAKSVGDRPKTYVKGLGNHVKSVGKNIAKQGKRGNVFGAAIGVVGGAISIPLHAAFGAAGTAVSLPGSAVSAAVKKPQTPRARAVAYVAVANKDWFGTRGLVAEIVDTRELCAALDTSVEDFVKLAKKMGDSAASQVSALEEKIQPLRLKEASKLQLGAETLWLVVTEVHDE